MIRIESYIRSKTLFVPIEQFAGVLRDPDYVWGAIEMTVDGQPIITRRERDLVPDLWAYVVTTAMKALKGEPAQTYFPDQPISLEMSPSRSRRAIDIRLSYPGVERLAAADPIELSTELSRAGRVFWSNFSRLIPAAASESANQIAELDQLSELVK